METSTGDTVCKNPYNAACLCQQSFFKYFVKTTTSEDGDEAEAVVSLASGSRACATLIS